MSDEGSKSACGECGKMCAPQEFHPHLHCVLWRAYKVNPADTLRSYGYQRVPR